ncbi:hypothetical protein SAPIO_CDS3861 [Scedosporium apiospermum]|uniref:Uncharacterized protein n=1 Tax=Pseudallescheria apiosperma TaxID=563466 RepID=A0A084G9T6_PSEDA|nr:uncharacterized protein SAPIO_CDS3861 [Scedosporium apiospermum]KEZ44098.1 hypothetical protein SAPIO_CDS3861 [Scedosporium apiospermum]
MSYYTALDVCNLLNSVQPDSPLTPDAQSIISIVDPTVAEAEWNEVLATRRSIPGPSGRLQLGGSNSELASTSTPTGQDALPDEVIASEGLPWCLPLGPAASLHLPAEGDALEDLLDTFRKASLIATPDAENSFGLGEDAAHISNQSQTFTTPAQSVLPTPMSHDIRANARRSIKRPGTLGNRPKSHQDAQLWDLLRQKTSDFQGHIAEHFQQVLRAYVNMERYEVEGVAEDTSLPITDEQKKGRVSELYAAILDFGDFPEGSKKVQPFWARGNLSKVVGADLADIELEMLCWEVLEAAIKSQRGEPSIKRWSGTEEATWEEFYTFGGRWRAICESVRRKQSNLRRNNRRKAQSSTPAGKEIKERPTPP